MAIQITLIFVQTDISRRKCFLQQHNCVWIILVIFCIKYPIPIKLKTFLLLIYMYTMWKTLFLRPYLPNICPLFFCLLLIFYFSFESNVLLTVQRLAWNLRYPQTFRAKSLQISKSCCSMSCIFVVLILKHFFKDIVATSLHTDLKLPDILYKHVTWEIPATLISFTNSILQIVFSVQTIQCMDTFYDNYNWNTLLDNFRHERKNIRF